MHRERNITEGVIWKQILIFFFPILLGTFFQQMYNTVDAIIVGRHLGTRALAAVGSTSSITNLVFGFFIGISSGATVLLSQSYGARDSKRVSEALHTGLLLAVALGLITAVVGICAAPAILKAIQTPADCMADAVIYAQIFFAGAVAAMIYNMGAGILRAMGDSRRPLIFLIITCVSNILLDLLFVVVLSWGVAGAALATTLAQAVSAVAVVICLCRLSPDIRLRFSQLKMKAQLLGRILAIGVPAGLQYVTFDLTNLLVQSGINSFGAVTMAAWTAFGKADGLTWMITGAFGVAVATFVGQNYGARRYDRIRKSVWVCLGMCAGILAALSALELPIRRYLLGFFTTDADVVRVGAYAMLWIVPFNLLFSPVVVFGDTMRGTGWSAVPTGITMACICGFRVLWVMTVVQRFHTLEMLCLVYPLSWLLASVVFYITYLRGRWLRIPPEETENE